MVARGMTGVYEAHVSCGVSKTGAKALPMQEDAKEYHAAPIAIRHNQGQETYRLSGHSSLCEPGGSVREAAFAAPPPDRKR